ncbi:hypothetical protein ACFQ1S_40270, partial [Kibdelosporangium lantanae]
TPVMHWLRDVGGPIEQFDQAMTVDVPEGVTRERVVEVLQAVVDHHDTLRLKLSTDWTLAVQPAVKVTLDTPLDPSACRLVFSMTPTSRPTSCTGPNGGRAEPGLPCDVIPTFRMLFSVPPNEFRDAATSPTKSAT